MNIVGFTALPGILEQEEGDSEDFFLEVLSLGFFTFLVFFCTWKGNEMSQQDIGLGEKDGNV